MTSFIPLCTHIFNPLYILSHFTYSSYYFTQHILSTRWQQQLSHVTDFENIFSEEDYISEMVLRNICTISNISHISNLSPRQTHIPQAPWLKPNQAKMAEEETTWSLTIMDRSWLDSGYFVYSTAVRTAAGGRGWLQPCWEGRQSCGFEVGEASDS